MNKKTVISAIAAAVILALGIGALLMGRVLTSPKTSAVDAALLKTFTYYERDGAIVFSGCTESVEEIVIPAEIDGLPVTSISDDAFGGGIIHWNLEKVVLPASVETIGNCAFQDCTALREINLENVREIGDMAFYGCCSMESVHISKNTVKIGERAFGGASFKLILDPENTSYRYADGCIYTADGKTVWRADSDIKKYTPPKGVTAIAPGAFEYTELESITLPDSVTEIGSYAFCNCLGLTEMEIPGSVRRIEDYTFTCCQNLTSVRLHNGLVFIGREAFCDDFCMTSMKIPASVKEIGGCAIGYSYYDGDSCQRLNDFTLYCTRGSAAYQYAKENGLRYKLVDK